MDIRQWSVNRIMQLPDCCFGRRFMISCTTLALTALTKWDISEIPFPEKAVIWEVSVWGNRGFPDIHSIRIALGDQLPTSVSMMDSLDPLFPGLGRQGAEPRTIIGSIEGFLTMRRIKMPVQAAGRRLILEVHAAAAADAEFTICLTVSSMPTEVPDWLDSGLGKSLL